MFKEPGTKVATELWNRAETVMSSLLIYPEARAAVAAARRHGRVDAQTLRNAVQTVDALYAQMSIIGLDRGLAQAAGNLAGVHRLRGYDAVHLATALSVEAESLLVATWDREFACAAVAAGCSVSPMSVV